MSLGQQHLKEDKLVKSVRGVNGGYALERPASEIKLSNIDDVDVVLCDWILFIAAIISFGAPQ